MRVAALDFGSNTFLLLICEVENQQVGKVWVDETEIVRLGQGMDQNKRFHPEALKRAEECLSKYSALISEYNVDKVLAVATSAARDAQNKDEFLNLVSKYQIPLRIIEGQEEASLTFQGSVFDQDKRKSFAVIDVGGGSTEIIGSSSSGVRGWSVDVGSVRLTERLLPEHPLREGDLENLRAVAFGEFEKVKEKIPDKSDIEVIAVAGTPVALAQIELGIEFDEDLLHGYELKLERISYWLERLASLSVDDRLKIQGMPEKRADVLVAGSAILEAALKVLNKDSLYVSTKGVRYGVALSLES